MGQLVCSASTKSGNRCKNKVLNEGLYCGVHKNIPLSKEATVRKLLLENENLDEVKKLLREGIDCNYCQENLLELFEKRSPYNTLIYLGIRSGDPEIVELLIKGGADVNEFFSKNLDRAAENSGENSYSINKILVESNPKYFDTNRNVKEYVKNVVVGDYVKETTNIKLLEYVLDKFGETEHAMYYAIQFGRLDAIKYLLSRKDLDVNSILLPSANFKLPEIVEIFFEHTNLNLEEYIRILPEFINSNQLSFYKKFVNFYLKDSNKHLLNRALSTSVRKLNLGAIRFLIEVGADVSFKSVFGEFRTDNLLEVLYSIGKSGFMDCFLLISQHYKLNPLLEPCISEIVSSRFQYTDDFLKVLQILSNIGINLLPEYIRTLDIKIGLLEEQISEVSKSRKRNKNTILDPLNTSLDELRTFRLSISNH